MKNINIKTRIILIVGPSSQGKTTLAKSLKTKLPGKNVVISHDEVLSLIDKNQPQFNIDMEFRIMLLEQIVNAVNDSQNTHIIIDTVNITKNSLKAFLMLLSFKINTKDITLLKLNISKELNLKYAKKHYPNLPTLNVTKNILEQREIYASKKGSLKTSFLMLVNNEFIIENEKINICF